MNHLLKIQKLLALTLSDNDNECLAAACANALLTGAGLHWSQIQAKESILEGMYRVARRRQGEV